MTAFQDVLSALNWGKFLNSVRKGPYRPDLEFIHPFDSHLRHPERHLFFFFGGGLRGGGQFPLCVRQGPYPSVQFPFMPFRRLLVFHWGMGSGGGGGASFPWVRGSKMADKMADAQPTQNGGPPAPQHGDHCLLAGCGRCPTL